MPRLRLTVGGPLGTASDWSNTLEYALGAPITSLATLQTIVNATFAALSASTAFKAGLCSDTYCNSVKALVYNSDTGPADLVATSSGTAFVGTTGAVHAPQVCVVASLRSNVAGRSYRGRIFTPYRGSTIGTSGVITSGGQTLVAAYVNAINTAFVTAAVSSSVSPAWIVYSPKTGSLTPLASILVGTQCDTVRHRNRNRAETYASYAITTVTFTGGSDVAAVVGAAANEPIITKIINKAGTVIEKVLPLIQYIPDE